MIRLSLALILFSVFSAHGTDQGCIEGDCNNGTGVYIDENGNRLEGRFASGKLEGEGEKQFVFGAHYKGQFKQGSFDGLGSYYDEEGALFSHYKGEWKDGKRNGQGTRYYKMGRRAEGHWKDGYLDGKATIYFEPGVRFEEFEGQWQDGKPVSGTMHLKNGNRYEGEYADLAIRHGKGTLYQVNGTRCGGDWGVGKLIEGSCHFSSGDRYEGHFQNNKFHGEGTYYYAGGKTQQGPWENGKPVNSGGLEK